MADESGYGQALSEIDLLVLSEYPKDKSVICCLLRSPKRIFGDLVRLYTFFATMELRSETPCN